MIAHLLDNAVRFSPQGGAIEVSVAEPDARVEIVVRDHSIGIPPEHGELLFDRFNQAHSDEYRSGLDLGLYIGNQVVSLSAQSSSSRGQTKYAKAPSQTDLELGGRKLRPSKA